MAITSSTQLANRYGLNIKICKNDSASTEIMTIDFANLSDISLSGDRTWATGGQDHANKIGFNNPVEGTFKLSTQIMTMQLLALVAGQDNPGEATSSVIFKNAKNSAPQYYKITADTVWQDEEGGTYTETLTFHKVCPKRAFNISYSGDGDPTSVDIEFDLMQDSDGAVLTVSKSEAS